MDWLSVKRTQTSRHEQMVTCFKPKTMYWIQMNSIITTLMWTKQLFWPINVGGSLSKMNIRWCLRSTREWLLSINQKFPSFFLHIYFVWNLLHILCDENTQYSSNSFDLTKPFSFDTIKKKKFPLVEFKRDWEKIERKTHTRIIQSEFCSVTQIVTADLWQSISKHSFNR